MTLYIPGTDARVLLLSGKQGTGGIGLSGAKTNHNRYIILVYSHGIHCAYQVQMQELCCSMANKEHCQVELVSLELTENHSKGHITFYNNLFTIVIVMCAHMCIIHFVFHV